MSRNRMSRKEADLYLLGMTLKDAVWGLTGDERPQTIQHWEWLVNLMEITARANPETAPYFSRTIRGHLPDPRVPF